jgi:hypothetical protein
MIAICPDTQGQIITVISLMGDRSDGMQLSSYYPIVGRCHDLPGQRNFFIS